MEETIKTKATISYGDSLNSLKSGSFYVVPEDAVIAQIDLHTPISDNEGGIQYQHNWHRIFIGRSMTSDTFVESYGKNLSTMELMDLKEQIKNGLKSIVILNTKDFKYEPIDEKDQICATHEELTNSIQRLLNKNVDYIESDYNSKKI